ncbi:uncharacterized protein BJ212DRAFT_1476169 [Suillus subaureus]|uniref:Uncharacterized protein n=1 Tax=Suillus subaureus TaxID=48587 RepID=A0A9P7EM41_9AGAM|nr:uncharacterized protein BJ212DRAFT_1476169 [Suillus subaureus]KAG1824881.1 hypothetical protein BJ212DRAFT_1476169 [Suillus subaureus]
MEFVLAVRNASLDDPIAKLSDDALEWLRNPPHGPIVINSPGVHQSISMYLALEHASQDAYNCIRRATARNFGGADGVDNLLSFYNVKKLITQYTGVESIEHDMCPKSCLAFTGPYADLDQCPLCTMSRWDQAKLQASNGHNKVAAQKFITIPLGPQLQSLYRDSENAHNMRYLHKCMQEILAQIERTMEIPIIDDIAMGYDYLGAVLDGDIKANDIVLMVSLDRAQLYESKQSDCWMYVWVILNLAPDKRYWKLHNVDSFLAVGIHHLAALQNEGLAMWDASHDAHFTSDLHLLYTTADGPRLVYWDGMDQCVEGSDHPDIDVCKLPPGGSADYAKNLFQLVVSPNQWQLDLRKIKTGIMKPPLIMGLSPSHCLSIPHCMTTDIMHLAANLSDLCLNLWHGTMDCGTMDDIAMWDWAVLQDTETWSTHGELVKHTGLYLPPSFDQKPRNIAN